MDGNPLLNPVGSLPPQVYWRRRLMVGVLVVLVLWFAWLTNPFKSGANAAQSGSHPPAATGAGTPSSSPTTTPSPTVTTAPTPTTPATAKATPAATVTSPKAAPTTTASPTPSLPKCPDASLTLAVSTDHRVYPAGALPKFTLDLANTGTTTCSVNVGSDSRDFTVTSGTDRIWSSSDCTKKTPNVAPFQAKESVGYTHVWNRQRSTPVGCAAQGTAARPGTYKVVAHVGGKTSAAAVFELR